MSNRARISLRQWAQRFSPAPADRTLRLWVAKGRIVPAPIKIGREYYVEPTAAHIAEVERRLVDAA
jgi:predicted site-specific integrase-resolvase